MGLQCCNQTKIYAGKINSEIVKLCFISVDYGVVMKADVYNKKLTFVANNGDLSVGGVLYREYSDCFDEWYGDPIPEDALPESGYPENDFYEWFLSRLVDYSDEEQGNDPEIAEVHLDEEIERKYKCET